jgi:hypothetical protein
LGPAASDLSVCVCSLCADLSGVVSAKEKGPTDEIAPC